MIKRFFTILICLPLFSSCDYDSIVYDNFTDIKDSKWSETDTLAFEFDIDDNNYLYTIYLNLRVTNDYKYSNIYLQAALGASFEKAKFKREHILLATPEGKWLGSGKGKIVTLQLPLYQEVQFNAPSTYKVQLSQEMRDALLENITSVGIMVKKGNPVF